MGRCPLRVCLREDTAAALTKCRPLPALNRLTPYLTPQQLKDVYDKFTSVHVSEFRTVEQMQTENGIFRLEEPSFLDCLEDDTTIDTIKFPTFMMELQPKAEQLRSQFCDKASQTEMSHVKSEKRRGWRKLFSGAFRRRASRKNTVQQSDLEIKTMFSPPLTPTDCSDRWIPSAQNDWGSSPPSSPPPTYDEQQVIKSCLSNFSSEPWHSRPHHNDREVFRFGLLSGI